MSIIKNGGNAKAYFVPWIFSNIYIVILELKDNTKNQSKKNTKVVSFHRKRFSIKKKILIRIVRVLE